MNQTEIRRRVMNYLKKNPMTIHNISKEIGVSTGLMTTFLKRGDDVSFQKAFIIESWIDRKENAEKLCT